MSYEAIVTRIYPQPHPNADRLQIAELFGDTVVVGLEVQAGDLGVFFPPDGQLSEEFAQANDLIRRKDAAGNNAGGMFDANRKVRAQKLRGVLSNGFWVPVSYFDYLSGYGPVGGFEEGITFSSIGGREICRKYVTPATLRAQAQGKKKGSGRHQTPYFPMHDDTAQLVHAIHSIPEGSQLVITAKAHGTSGRAGNVLDEQPVTGWRKLVNRALRREVFAPKLGYSYLHGTRRVILSRKAVFANDFHSHSLREEVADVFDGKLKPGELVFFEVVGFEPDGKPIMPPADTTKLSDKKFSLQYGKTMHWSYGCAPDEHRILIYRIAYSLADGTIIDLPWQDVKRRAAELGVETVVELATMIHRPVGTVISAADSLLRDVESLANETDPLGSHWMEGVCVRVDGARWRVFKHKNRIFKFLESIIKDDPTVVDTEEAA